MIVKPEIIVTPDCPTVILREPREQVDLAKLMPAVLNAQGWGVGTYFHVHFVSFDRAALLAAGRFVVTGVSEALRTNETNPYQPVTTAVSTRTFEQVGDWWEPGVSMPDAPQARAVWNVGKKGYDIMVGDEVVAHERDKQKAEALAGARAA